MEKVIITNARSFKDLDLNFTIHPIKKDINVHSDHYAVINSLKNLVMTNFYERPFQPELGCNLRRLLFENVDMIVASNIEHVIEETVKNYEPRVEIKNIIALPDPDNNKYNIEIQFYIVNISEPITIKFYLERIR